jgi:hypothetical protein
MNEAVVSEARISNGSGAAAILAAGVGSLVLGVLSFAGDKSAAFKASMDWYKPTGALSGVTTAAIAAWLVVWVLLELRWNRKSVAAGRTNAAALTMLALGLLLTFPPLVDLI